MSENNTFSATVRERVGKGAARETRRQGMIPAVIYGDKKPAIPITLPYKAINERIHAGGFLTSIMTIDVNGDKVRVIPKAFDLDPVRDFPIHIDFLRISKGATVTVNIPVNFINEEDSPGIKRGGVVNIVRHEVELECKIDAIPENLVCDLTGLEISDTVHISDIELPEGAKPTIRDRDFTIATIAAPAGMTDGASEGDEADEANEESE